MSAFSVMAKRSCMCVLISVYRSTQLTETAVIDKLFRDEVMFWAPVADLPDSSIAPPANGRADHRRATPPAGVMDLQVDSYDAVKRTVTLTWTSPGDDGRSGTGV
ncbi:uncharacterized protein LOC125380996 [Haliotis rufescens]|uniref:uncharacterized protein LOC125380996 n=1 Tax=Haliotis rufescens TaxID=6454 RepID=UPI00201E7A6B|nr:uncharacterized protein LOC125380996 [Haliotis rufescens]